MAFQTKVLSELAKGIPGAQASINRTESTAVGYVADGDVTIGGFVWRTEANKCASKGSGAPLGFAHLDRIYTIIDITKGAVNYAPDGAPVSVMAKGDFYATTTTAATAGQKVWANAADGTIAADDGSFEDSGRGMVETEFYFAEDAEANDVTIITTNR